MLSNGSPRLKMEECEPHLATLTHHTPPHMHTRILHTPHTDTFTTPHLDTHSKVSGSIVGLWVPARSPEEVPRVHIDPWSSHQTSRCPTPCCEDEHLLLQVQAGVGRAESRECPFCDGRRESLAWRLCAAASPQQTPLHLRLLYVHPRVPCSLPPPPRFASGSPKEWGRGLTKKTGQVLTQAKLPKRHPGSTQDIPETEPR